MIYSIIILILSLLLFPVHPFYIINAGVIEQCSTGTNLYLNQFDSKKMRCLNKKWRQVFISLEYTCVLNSLRRRWKIQTNVNQGSTWPRQISVLTNKDHKQFGTIANQESLIIEEDPMSFNSNNNQFITYIWTELSNGPQCRIKFTVIKDICTKQNQTLGAKFTDFVCYHGKQTFNFIQETKRNEFNKLISDSMKASSNTAQNNSSINNSSSNSQRDPDLLAINAGKQTFFEKNKLYIFIGAGIGVVIVIVAIIFIIMNRRDSSNKTLETRMSVESAVE